MQSGSQIKDPPPPTPAPPAPSPPRIKSLLLYQFTDSKLRCNSPLEPTGSFRASFRSICISALVCVHLCICVHVRIGVCVREKERECVYHRWGAVFN